MNGMRDGNAISFVGKYAMVVLIMKKTTEFRSQIFASSEGRVALV